MLHSGHIAFLKEAASYGDLYVALGSDATVYDLKGRAPINNEQERLYMMRAVDCVTEAFVSLGSGMLDYETELRQIQPDIFIVNEDGNIPQKEALCHELGIEYRVLQRRPHADLPARSTTALRQIDQMPYRIDLAGGWLDQPFVSKLYSGPVITVSIEPTVAFNERSGMATSTRNAALDLWGPRLPTGDPRKLAKILFCYDNPPGTVEISGSQDAIGIVMPALNRSFYDGEYWPSEIQHVSDEQTLQFIEESLHLIPLGPRASGYNPLQEKHLTVEHARALSDATESCWQAILNHDVAGFGRYTRESFEAQKALFPHTTNAMVDEMIMRYQDQALGWKLCGAGGSGYMLLVSDRPIEHSVRITIRRGTV